MWRAGTPAREPAKREITLCFCRCIPGKCRLSAVGARRLLCCRKDSFVWKNYRLIMEIFPSLLYCVNSIGVFALPSLWK